MNKKFFITIFLSVIGLQFATHVLTDSLSFRQDLILEVGIAIIFGTMIGMLLGILSKLEKINGNQPKQTVTDLSSHRKNTEIKYFTDGHWNRNVLFPMFGIGIGFIAILYALSDFLSNIQIVFLGVGFGFLFVLILGLLLKILGQVEKIVSEKNDKSLRS